MCTSDSYGIQSRLVVDFMGAVLLLFAQALLGSIKFPRIINPKVPIIRTFFVLFDRSTAAMTAQEYCRAHFSLTGSSLATVSLKFQPFMVVLALLKCFSF